MEIEKFYEMFGRFDNLKVTVYYGDEIPAIFNITDVTVEEYDDELIIRGIGNTFVILKGDPRITKSEIDDEEEFVFNSGEMLLGITFYNGTN